ncbi:hypothetical protein ACFV1F_16935 [Streptomyces sp. NPDC059590]|uniref:hypothetical protein n=1 Tax=Streptomyces sp. NPDC059590 TaxID=3346877 RepID=UPI0036C8A094
MDRIDRTPAPGARRTSPAAIQLRDELARQLSRLAPRVPLTPDALSAAWDRALQCTLPDQTAAAMNPLIASVILSIPRPTASITCMQYAHLMRKTAARDSDPLIGMWRIPALPAHGAPAPAVTA